MTNSNQQRSGRPTEKEVRTEAQNRLWGKVAEQSSRGWPAADRKRFIELMSQGRRDEAMLIFNRITGRDKPKRPIAKPEHLALKLKPSPATRQQLTRESNALGTKVVLWQPPQVREIHVDDCR